MDGPLLFRIVLITVAGIALVLIISNYNNTIGSELNRQGRVDEKFESGRSMETPAFNSTVSASSPPIPSGEVMFTENGSLTSTAGSMSSSGQNKGAPLPSGSIDSLKPEDLLPRLGNTPEERKFVSVNPSVAGDVGSQNFLQAGYWQGAITNVNKIANKQLRSDPLIVPQKVSPWLNTPFEMNSPNRPFEIGSVNSS
jgi:hypothetical protein